MDLADLDVASVVAADEILRALARKVRYGQEARGGIGTDQHDDDGKCNDVASIPDHNGAPLFFCTILVHRDSTHHAAPRPPVRCSSRRMVNRPLLQHVAGPKALARGALPFPLGGEGRLEKTNWSFCASRVCEQLVSHEQCAAR